MGLRGPIAESLEHKRLKGTLRPDRERQRAAAGPPASEAAPPELLAIPAWVRRSRDARAAWALAVAAGTWLTAADVPALEAYAGAVAQMRRAERHIARHRDVVTTPYGPRPNPYTRVLRDARTQIAMLSRVLRLDPSSRLRNPAPAKPKGADASEDFLFGARRARFFGRARA